MKGISKNFKSGSIAIVSGGGKGLGKQICLNLAKLGVIVYVNDIDSESLSNTISEIEKAGGKAYSGNFDVTDKTACEKWVNEIFNLHGKIDFLFTNAGKVAIGDFEKVTSESWHRIMEVNFFGQLHFVMAAYKLMKQQNFGKIIIVSSIAGLVFQPLTASYSSSKHALAGLAYSLYPEAKNHNIDVHLVCPGYIDMTSIFNDADTFGYSSEKIKNILRRKMGGFILADAAARKILQGIDRKKFLIVFPLSATLYWYSFRIFPTLTVKYSKWIIRMVQSAKNNP